MLILPLTGKINKNNLPYATILIILINCFVFFFLQSDDTARQGEAYRFYKQSGLADIELSKYRLYVEKNHLSADSTSESDEPLDKHEQLSKMIQDQAFQAKLVKDQIITPSDPQYPDWKKLRTEFEQLQKKTSSFQYGLIPSDQKPINLLTHMFVHGSFMHLLGNMIFLWLVGCSLELGCGRIFYLLLYVMSGVAACESFALTQAESTVPLIGASGAISGLMGAFTVIYGKRKIKILYSLIFYFNYAMVPALILLPIWIGFELFKLFTHSNSNVAYMAHIGGLATGALIGFLYLKLIGKMNEKVFEEDPKEKIPLLLDRALQHIENLNMKNARLLLEEILAIDPSNRKAMMHLFHIEKLTPNDIRFHHAATRFLLQLSKEATAGEFFLKFWEEYEKAPVSDDFQPDAVFEICINLMGTRSYKTIGTGFHVPLRKSSSTQEPAGNDLVPV